jgi:hypothetical protein
MSPKIETVFTKKGEWNFHHALISFCPKNKGKTIKNTLEPFEGLRFLNKSKLATNET